MNYTVKPGDSLARIAQQYGVTVDALLRANPQIKDPSLIYPGQVIAIPQAGRPGTPGWGQPGGGQPGWGQPGWGQPGGGQPGWGQPGGGQPGWGQPGGGQPGWGQPGGGQPGWGQPGWGQPGWGQPGWGQPGWGQPGWGQPGWGQPGWGQPGWGQPGWGQPGWGPGWGQPGWGRPGWGQPGRPGNMYPWNVTDGYDKAVVQYGDQGPHVEHLQTKLQEMGYYNGSVTGKFDRRTLKAVKGLQKDCNCEANGVVDGYFWSSMGPY